MGVLSHEILTQYYKIRCSSQDASRLIIIISLSELQFLRITL